jgi:hypothetical protein
VLKDLKRHEILVKKKTFVRKYILIFQCIIIVFMYSKEKQMLAGSVMVYSSKFFPGLWHNFELLETLGGEVPEDISHGDMLLKGSFVPCPFLCLLPGHHDMCRFSTMGSLPCCLT